TQRSTLSPYTTLFRSRVRTILNGVDLGEFHPDTSGVTVRAELGWTRNPIIAATSRLDPEKGHETLLDAMRIVVQHRPDCRLLIRSEEHTSELQSRVDL